MTRHELVGTHGCVCGFIASDFDTLIIHLIRGNGGEFIVSERVESDETPAVSNIVRKT